MISTFRQAKLIKMPSGLYHWRYWPTWFGLGLFYLFSQLPIKWIDAFGAKTGRFLARKNRKRHNIVKTNLGLCFPELDAEEIDKMTIRHFELVVKGLFHYGLLWWGSEKRLKKLLNPQGFDQIEKYRESGKNVIVLLSHCTGLEFAVLAIIAQFESAGPYKPFSNPVIDWLIERSRKRFGDAVFTRDEGLRPVIRNAKKGKVIIYLADEDLGADVSLFAPFMGVNKATVPVLGRLADACNAVVLPAISCYNEDLHQYKVTIFEPMEDYPVKEPEQDTIQMNKMIEETVKSCPLQYFWTLKLFKTRPEGEPQIYS